jgi:hypothetical protein
MLVIARVQAHTNLHTAHALDLTVAADFDLGVAGARFEDMRVG